MPILGLLPSQKTLHGLAQQGRPREDPAQMARVGGLQQKRAANVELQGRPTVATPGSTALFNLVFGAAKFTAATAAAHCTTWKQLRAKILTRPPSSSKNATTNPGSIGTPFKVLQGPGSLFGLVSVERMENGLSLEASLGLVTRAVGLVQRGEEVATRPRPASSSV